MPKYRITGPDGAAYDVDAPDDEAVGLAVQQMFGGGQPPAAPAAPQQAPGGTDMPAMARAPGSMGQPEEPGFLARHGRNLMLGTQAVGRGVADLATMPFNLSNSAANIALTGADMVADKVFGSRVPFRFNTQLDQLVASAVEAGVNAAGVPTFEPQNALERTAYNITRFGTQAVAGGAAMMPLAIARESAKRALGAAPSIVDGLLAPYGGGNAGSVLAGDAAAGAGSGAALTASQELIPQNVRDAGGGSVGAIADLFAMLAGGVGGGAAKELATRAPVSVFDKVRGSMNDSNVPLDPDSLTPTPRRIADEAAKFVQGRAINPEQAARNIDETAAAYRGQDLPVPTSGLISGDVGLESMERGVRAQKSTDNLVTRNDADPGVRAQYNFGARDQALQDAAIGQVESMRPANAEPRAFTDRAAEVAATQRDQAQRAVDQAAGRERGVEIARRGPAADLQATEGQGTAASTNIDRMARETRNAEVQQKNALYNNPELTNAEVPVDPLRQTAGELGAADTQAAPLAPVVRKYVDRFGAIDEGTPITMREVNANRAEIEADIAANLDNGEVVRQLRQLKETVNRYADTLAQTDGPAAEAAAAANANYRERFQPNFRQGAGGQFDQALKNERAGGTPVRPSETAETFLTSPEGTADLMRIAALRGNEQATAQQARTWLFDQLARKGVARDGAIDAEALTRWRNVNEPTLANVPGLRDEVNQMVAAARRGETLSEQASAAVRAAEARAAETARGIDRGPLGLVEGKAPPQAVAAVFNSGDPERAMRELASTVGRNAPAKEGLKAAVADHLVEKVTNVNPAAVSEGAQNVGYAKLVREFRKNERALAEVYSPEEMQALQRAQKLLEPLGKLRGQATSGSPTAERSSQAWRPLEVALKGYYGILKGGGVFRTVKLAASVLGNDDAAQVERLVARMMFDPKLASHLLTRKVAEVNTPGWNSGLQKIIRRAQAAKELTAPGEEEQK